jgi:hypothetical protein
MLPDDTSANIFTGESGDELDAGAVRYDLLGIQQRRSEIPISARDVKGIRVGTCENYLVTLPIYCGHRLIGCHLRGWQPDWDAEQ